MRPASSIAALLGCAALALPAAGSAQTRGGPLSSIFKCEASGSKQETGALIGAAVGGVIGNNVARNERGLGTALGAALGAAAGSYIGCKMQVSDQQKAEAAARAALESGRYQSWNNSETGASGDVRVVSTQGGGKPVSMAGLRLASGVQLADSYSGAGGRYEARGPVNLRAAPSTSAPLLGRFKAGEGFDALARVNGTGWLLAGRKGVGIGYVADSVVRPAGGSYAGGPLCRTFDQTITTPGGSPDTRRYTACQGANGEWVVQG